MSRTSCVLQVVCADPEDLQDLGGAGEGARPDLQPGPAGAWVGGPPGAWGGSIRLQGGPGVHLLLLQETQGPGKGTKQEGQGGLDVRVRSINIYSSGSWWFLK